MKKANLAVILINFNCDQETMECIKSINNGTIVPDIILVDNASDNFNRVKFDEFQNVTIIENKTNLGFSGGNNIAIDYAIKNKYEYIALLNNDTIVDNQMFENLLKEVKHNIIVTPKMYYYSNPEILWFAGGYINYIKGEAFHIGIGEKDTGKYDTNKKISFATGCCWLMQREIFERIGYLSEEYFMYCEDTDFCLRCRKNKIDIMYIPSAKLWHKVGVSSSKESITTVYYKNRNRFYLIAKHKLGVIPYCFTFASRTIKYLIAKLLKSNEIIIKQSYIDYKQKKMGKVDLERLNHVLSKK